MKTRIISFFIITFCCSYLSATIINIPADQPTIQSGINIAVDGDTVSVQPETYVENINYNGKNITVASLFLTTQDTSYISQTIIDGNQNGTVVIFENGEDYTAVLTGFTITNGLANYGGGIRCRYSSSPTLDNLMITNNAASNIGGGIDCYSYSSPIIKNVKIENNTAEYGGGIAGYNNSSPSIDNVMITCNIASHNGGGMGFLASSPILEHVIISNNSANWYAGGISCWDSSNVTLINVTICDNSAISYGGGGVYCYNASNVTVCNSIIWNNSPEEIYFYGTYEPNSITISYSDIQYGEAGIVTNNNGTVYWFNGNIDNYPLFVDPANGDYHITEFSPCIDAGDPNSPLDPDGTVADMGAYYYDQSEYDITFNSLADMNTARYGFGYCNDENYLYAIDGGTYEPPYYRVNNIERYDPTTNNWEVFVDGLIPRRYCTAEYIQSTNKIYIFGGQTYYVSNPATYTDTVEVVDVANGNITYLTSNPIPYTSSGSAVWNNKTYIFGGSQHGVYSSELYEFDPINNIWNQLPDMPEAKQTEGEIVDGILYVFGGYNGSASNRIDAYDIQNNEWSFIGYIPFGISAHHTTVSGQYIWLIGDYDNLESVAVFNTETHEFTQLNTNMIGRRHCGTEVIGNNLYVYGGNVASAGPALSSLQYADISYLSIDDEPNGIPSSITLFQNYPNPFYPKTTISFSIKQNSEIELEIFNIKGQKVKTLINEFMQSGNHAVFWNGDDAYGNKVSSGLYFYKLSVNGRSEVVKKCLLVDS